MKIRCSSSMGCVFSLLALALAFWLWTGAAAQAQLVGYWPFDGDVLDASGTGNNGTLFGATFDLDVPTQLGGGQSLSFAGGADRVNVAANPSLNSGSFTLSYWVKDPGQTANFNRITSRGGDTFETAVGDSGNRLFKFFPGWTNTSGTSSAADFKHVAYVYNDATLRAYVDGALVHTQNVSIAPSGLLNIGSRHNNSEGIAGKIDDVALFSNPLAPSAVQRLASGASSPADLNVTTVTSNPADWSLSTVRTSGGAAGTWTPGALPALDGTFTLAASPATIANIIAAGNDLGVGSINAGGDAGAPEGVQYYRATFELENFDSVSASLVSAFDNGGQIFINGAELARETSFLVENWASPYSSLNVNEDGSISDVTLFDLTAANFTDFVVGTNEILVAVRNPDADSLTGGGFALRLDVVTTSAAVVPEPSSIAMWSLLGIGLTGFAFWSRLRKLARVSTVASDESLDVPGSAPRVIFSERVSRMNRFIGMCKLTITVVAIGLLATYASAQTITTSSQTSVYTVANDDLLQTDVINTIASPNAAAFAGFGTGGLPVLTDGSGGANSTNSFPTSSIPSSGSSVVYTLDTTTNPLGYNLTAVNTYGEWDEGRDRQDITVAYSTVLDPATFIDIATYSFDPPGPSPNFSLVSVTPMVGDLFLATDVGAVRFTFPNQENNGGGYRELDVFGSPVAAAAVPEPTSIAIWSLMGLVLAGFGYYRIRRNK